MAAKCSSASRLGSARERSSQLGAEGADGEAITSPRLLMVTAALTAPGMRIRSELADGLVDLIELGLSTVSL
jgi:hypothetical protein